MLGTPFPPWPSFTGEEAEAIQRVLLSNRVNYWTGEEGRAFEREFARWTGTKHAVALSNGTLALELILQSLDLEPGDEVVVTPRTFIASVSSIVNAGAVPVFADVDRDTQNITAETIARVLTPRTKGIMTVHLAGMPCDMDPIVDLADENSLYVIEDCAQAHGARYKDRPVGSFGRAAAWSFCQDKIMTTGGEGGMATTNDEELWRRIWAGKDHGKSYQAVYETKHGPGYRWLHDRFGSNHRMLEIQAVIGRLQLTQLPEWCAARRVNAGRILEAARNLPAYRVPNVPGWAEPACYKCYVFVEPDALADGWDRDRIMSEIVAAGVPCYSGTCPEVYREKAFDGTDWRPAAPLPVARELGETSLMFLVHPTLTEDHISRTCDALRDVASRATKQA